MSAGHTQHPALLQNVLGQKGRPRGVGQTGIQHILNGLIASRQGITDDDQVGFRLQMIRVIAFAQIDALLLQLGTHWRVDIGIRATDLHAQLSGQ